MSSAVQIAEFLDRLPRRVVQILPANTTIPKLTTSGYLQDYNGFTGGERLRTFEIAKWLIRNGAIAHSGRCDICGGPGDQQHAEDYFDLTTWMDICRGCHISLHARFRTPAAWARRLDIHSLADDHWARALSPFELDVAAFHRASGRPEPSATDFITAQNG